MVKSRVASGGTGGSSVLGISSSKVSTMISFLQGSKWLPYNEINSIEVDKGDTSMMNSNQTTSDCVKTHDVASTKIIVERNS